MVSTKKPDPENEKKLDQKMFQRIQELRLIDDEFFAKCFEDNIECTELLLHIILDKEDLKVERVQTQYQIKNLQGRSVILDVFASDTEGKKYNIEIQRSDKGASLKRARYYRSMIDANITSPGDDYDELPETYVIFITENDVLQLGLPIYYIENKIRGTNVEVNDGTHTIYVNGEYKGKDRVGELIHDIMCKDPNEMNFEVLARRVRHFKEEPEGRMEMTGVFEKFYNEGKQEGLERGKLEGLERGKLEGKLEERKATAREFIAEGIAYEVIAKCCKLTLEEVQQLAKQTA